jgi:hypothetical protein
MTRSSYSDDEVFVDVRSSDEHAVLPMPSFGTGTGLKFLGSHAFDDEWCSSLVSIDFPPPGFESVGGNASAGCKAALNHVEFKQQ